MYLVDCGTDLLNFKLERTKYSQIRCNC